jgi:hypothetical protein
VVLGIVFIPWTTLAIVIVAPGGADSTGWLIIALAFVGDLSTHGTSRLLFRPFSPGRTARS